MNRQHRQGHCSVGGRRRVRGAHRCYVSHALRIFLPASADHPLGSGDAVRWAVRGGAQQVIGVGPRPARRRGGLQLQGASIYRVIYIYRSSIIETVYYYLYTSIESSKCIRMPLAPQASASDPLQAPPPHNSASLLPTRLTLPHHSTPSRQTHR
jgi:hypothetical protein